MGNELRQAYKAISTEITGTIFRLIKMESKHSYVRLHVEYDTAIVNIEFLDGRIKQISSEIENILIKYNDTEVYLDLAEKKTVKIKTEIIYGTVNSFITAITSDDVNYNNSNNKEIYTTKSNRIFTTFLDIGAEPYNKTLKGKQLISTDFTTDGKQILNVPGGLVAEETGVFKDLTVETLKIGTVTESKGLNDYLNNWLTTNYLYDGTYEQIKD